MEEEQIDFAALQRAGLQPRASRGQILSKQREGLSNNYSCPRSGRAAPEGSEGASRVGSVHASVDHHMSVAMAKIAALDRRLDALPFFCQVSPLLQRGLETKETTQAGGAERPEGKRRPQGCWEDLCEEQNSC